MILAAVLSSETPWTWIALGAAWVLRWLTIRGIQRVLGFESSLPFWAVPLRDLLSMAVLLSSYGGDRVAWRGQILHADSPSLLPGKG